MKAVWCAVRQETGSGAMCGPRPVQEVTRLSSKAASSGKSWSPLLPLVCMSHCTQRHLPSSLPASPCGNMQIARQQAVLGAQQ